MPDSVRSIYEEARTVAHASPRAAAALLRLAVETIVNDLEPGPEKFNSKIGTLVTKGLDHRVQKMLDAVRIVGNDTLHAGEINLREHPDVPQVLMGLVNQIVEQVITRNRELDELMSILPPKKLAGVQERDRKDPKLS